MVYSCITACQKVICRSFKVIRSRSSAVCKFIGVTCTVCTFALSDMQQNRNKLRLELLLTYIFRYIIVTTLLFFYRRKADHSYNILAFSCFSILLFVLNDSFVFSEIPGIFMYFLAFHAGFFYFIVVFICYNQLNNHACHQGDY